MKKLAYTGLVALLALPGGRAAAQYYDWGQEPASVRWNSVQAENGPVVFPDYYRRQGLRMAAYMDTLRGSVGYGYRRGPMKMPLLLHTQNHSTNGIVILAPSRMEFILTPPAATFSMPWHKQLAVHEYRHAVQYNNTDRNFVRVLSWFLGQQGSLVGLGQLPQWMVEGDAVLTETQFSTFGRGVQPSNTLHYRALFDARREGARFRHGYRPDKFFSGSYRDYMPDHYTIGYHIVRWSWDRYGENIWDRVSWFNSRNPYMIFPTTRALRKFYGTTSTAMFHETLERLSTHWDTIERQENSMTPVVTTNTSYTTYQSPVPSEDGKIYSLKTDLDRHTRLVKTDVHGDSEVLIANVGQVNTGLTRIGDRLWWTELRQSTLRDQRVGSQLCWYDLSTERQGVEKMLRNVIYPSVSREGTAPAYLRYNKEGYYTLVTTAWELDFDYSVSLHGLAYDRTTDAYYVIVLDDAGMSICRVAEDPAVHGHGFPGPDYGDGSAAGMASPATRESALQPVLGPAFITLSDLRAWDGTLLYGSIATGRDEAHILDLATGVEKTLTASRYGSFSPSFFNSSRRWLVTTYTVDGYKLAIQSEAYAPLTEVAPSSAPPDLFSPPGSVQWDVMNIDTVVLDHKVPDREVRRYRKGAHQFRFHSWAPFWFEPDKLMDEDRLNVHIGATVLSQNLLNSTFATFGYKYTDKGSLFSAGLKFYGLPTKFEIDAEYGTMPQSATSNYSGPLDNHYSVAGRVYMPLLLGAGYHVRWLTPVVEVQHANTRFVEYGTDGSSRAVDGVQKVRLALTWNDNVRLAHRDFVPRWGYALRASHTMTPFETYYGGITSLYGRVYLPGILPHNSVMIRGAVQKQSTSFYNFAQKEIFPRGAHFYYAPDRYGAFNVDYALPLAYPDWGINSLLYLRRIRADVYFDGARMRTFTGQWTGGSVVKTETRWRNIYSYGLELTLDLVPFRLPPNTDTSFTISVWKPSDHKRPVVSAGLVLPL